MIRSSLPTAIDRQSRSWAGCDSPGGTFESETVPEGAEVDHESGPCCIQGSDSLSNLFVSWQVSHAPSQQVAKSVSIVGRLSSNSSSSMLMSHCVVTQ